LALIATDNLLSMKKVLLFTFLLLTFFSLHAQRDKRENREFINKYLEADYYIHEDNYLAALHILLELYQKDINNPNINFLIGACYMNQKEYDKAHPFLLRALPFVSHSYTQMYSDTTASMYTHYYLGIVNQVRYRFSEAIYHFNIFKYYLNSEYADSPRYFELISELERWVEMCHNAEILIADRKEIRIENIGAPVNTGFPEYSPVVSIDEKTMYFTTRRPANVGGLKDIDNKYFEDIYIATYNDTLNRWDNVVNMGDIVNTRGHEASVSLSHDGKQLFIYKDDKGVGNIYVSNLVNNRWSKPEKLSINSNFWEPHACLSPDGRTLFFSSNRPGGYGGLDIYKSVMMPNGEWSRPENLGPVINSKYDEDSPFMLADGKTLFFASKGHNSMGGFDVFTSVWNEDDNSWSKPENLGYPINTTEDDVFYYPTVNPKVFYYSSSKHGGYGDMDIYKVTILDERDAIAIYRGNVFDEIFFRPLDATFIIYERTPGTDTTKTLIQESDAILPTFELKTIIDGEGVVDKMPNYDAYNYGDIVTLTARQASGWNFNGWSGDVTSNERSLNIVMDEDKTVNATFVSIYDEGLTQTDRTIYEELTEEELNRQQALIYEQMQVNMAKRAGYVKTIQTYHRTGEFYTNLQVGKHYEVVIIAYGYDTLVDYIDIPSIEPNQVFLRMYLLRKEGTALAELQLEEEELEIDGLPKVVYFEDIKELRVGDRIVLRNILYDFDKATLRPESIEELGKLIEFMEARPNLRVEISSHTDNRGSARYNKRLSEQRAQSVVDYLTNNGIDISRLEAVGYGFDDPIATNDTDEGRQMNRRTEFKVIGM